MSFHVKLDKNVITSIYRIECDFNNQTNSVVQIFFSKYISLHLNYLCVNLIVHNKSDTQTVRKSRHRQVQMLKSKNTPIKAIEIILESNRIRLFPLMLLNGQ